LLHKNKEENMENATLQKQECGCPSLQLPIKIGTGYPFATMHVLFYPNFRLDKFTNIKSHFKAYFDSLK
jgi:hypothetical protein